MGNGASTDQGSHTTYGSRDVEETAEQYNWSELAEASQTKLNLIGRSPHNLESEDGLLRTLSVPRNDVSPFTTSDNYH